MNNISCLRCSIKGNIALQCSLVLSGIKPSNLLIYSNHCEGCISEELKNTGAEHMKLYTGSKESVSIIFNREKLEKALLDEENRKFIKQYGYEDFSVNSVIEKLAGRYTGFKEGRAEFPHEMGIVLGYPLEDVSGFIENNGKNYIYSGYWKVYKNAEEKIQLFKIYKDIKKYFVEQIENGRQIHQICSECREFAVRAA
ncbi:DUF3793 family protein [Peptoclostridium sp. AF21-18]|uniref:DUF3793 family protein n=1 Tax=Peptoclostridium sp. AF21-18 TaxID=2292243 RepID=UPI000E513E59|nr:DUF3793 family protein [Peptoclostridium sp. AF21-18]RHQ99627.1 DUF3793 family protein [Peptoclostridium sp. AF21-18]